VDYFSGSGTTAHAIMNLNRADGGHRRYIMVEIADYFETALKPRIQKIAFSSAWKDGLPQGRDGQSHMFKYQRIESYEDALNNIRVEHPGAPQQALLYEKADDYMLSYMLDFETRGSPTLLSHGAFDKPFAYTLKIEHGRQTPQDTIVDLVETFHYLIGMHVRRFEQHEHQNRRYVVTRGEVRTDHGVETVVTLWRDTENLDLEKEADWVGEQLVNEPVDRVYVNGPSFIDKAEPLEITFRQLMEAPVNAV
jgi:adenine-specific DNA-methyltransferase